MSVSITDFEEAMLEKRWMLGFLPVLTFGYLYHLTTDQGYLWFGLYLLFPAVFLVAERGANISIDYSKPRHTVLHFLVIQIPLILSYPLGFVLLYLFRDPMDLIAIGLFYSNAFMVVVSVFNIWLFARTGDTV